MQPLPFESRGQISNLRPTAIKSGDNVGHPRGVLMRMRGATGTADGRCLIGSMIATFALVRVWLHINPNADLNVGPYNVHHLFTGVVILTACGLPAVIGDREGPMRRALVAGFGIGLSLVLDEWLYLIVTDGSNAAYVGLSSLVGGATMVGVACLYAAWLSRRS